MVKGFTKTELMKQMVDSAAFDKAAKNWRHAVFKAYPGYPTYGMVVACVVAMILLGYGFGSGLVSALGWWCVILGVVIALRMVQLHRRWTLAGVREALGIWLQADMPEAYWWRFPSVDMIPGHLVIRKEKAVHEHIRVNAVILDMLNGLWGNLLFFVPSRVDAYVMRFMLAEDVHELQRRIASHLRNGEDLKECVEELGQQERGVVPLRRGGGTKIIV